MTTIAKNTLVKSGSIANARKTFAATLLLSALAFFGMAPIAQQADAQARKAVFQSGEELVYKVKFGFVKLGTVVVRTGTSAGANKMNASLQFWTADNPFLTTKTKIDDVIDTHEVYLVNYKEHTTNGDNATDKNFTYDRGKKQLVYNDAHVQNEVSNNIEPFSDALTLLFNIRTWSGAGQTYGFKMRGKEGQKTVALGFTKQTSDQEVEAFGDDAVKCRVVKGKADMGDSSPLGANGDFTAYVTDDAAAIPARIDMKIAIGSITLELVKATRSGYAAAKSSR